MSLPLKLAVATCILLLYRWFRRTNNAGFKQPLFHLPGLGHLHLFDIRNLAWELERLRIRVGDKVMGLYLGRELLVYVVTPQLTHKVFVENGDKSSDRSAEMPPELDSGNKGVVLNSGEVWKKNRILLLRELVGSQHKVMIVKQVFDELVTKVADAASKSGGEVPEFGKLIHKAVCSGMCVMIFGFKLPDARVDEILGHVDYIGAKSFDYMMMVRLPFYKWFGFETVKKFEWSCQSMLRIVDEILDEKKAVDVLADGRQDKKNLGMPSADKEIIPNLNEILFEAIQGGLDTTTAVQEWTIAYLTAYPEFQKRIHEEMDAVCGKDGPTLDDREVLPCLHAAIYESLRLAQISSLIVPHKSTEEIELGQDYPHIPTGTTLLFSFNYLHASPELWQRDPMKFHPERFLEEDKGLDPNPNSGVTATGGFKKFVPFGLGPRHCPGFALATLELYVGLSKLLWEFEFTSVKPVDLAHYTNSIPVRVKDFKPIVIRRVKKV